MPRRSRRQANTRPRFRADARAAPWAGFPCWGGWGGGVNALPGNGGGGGGGVISGCGFSAVWVMRSVRGAQTLRYKPGSEKAGTIMDARLRADGGGNAQ